LFQSYIINHTSSIIHHNQSCQCGSTHQISTFEKIHYNQKNWDKNIVSKMYYRQFNLAVRPLGRTWATLSFHHFWYNIFETILENQLNRINNIVSIIHHQSYIIINHVNVVLRIKYPHLKRSIIIKRTETKILYQKCITDSLI